MPDKTEPLGLKRRIAKAIVRFLEPEITDFLIRDWQNNGPIRQNSEAFSWLAEQVDELRRESRSRG